MPLLPGLLEVSGELDDVNHPGFDGGSDDTEGSLSWDRRSTPMSCASEPRGRALEALADPARAKGAIRRTAEEPGVHPEALRTWVRKAQIDQDTRPGTTTDEAQRIKELEKEVREPRGANAILRNASACLSRRSVSARPADLPVHRDQEGGVWGLADLQGAHWRRSQDRPEHVTHARRSRPPGARSLRDEALKAEIRRVHESNYSVLGARKMHVMRGRPEIAERHGAGRGPLYRRTPRGRPGPTAASAAPSPRAPRAAHRESSARPTSSSATSRRLLPMSCGSPAFPRKREVPPHYVRTFSGWVYVAFVTDVNSRRIIGWQTSTSLYTDLAAGALKMAIWQRKRTGADLTGLVHHLQPRRAVQVHPLRAGPIRLRRRRISRVEGGPPFGFALAEALNSLYNLTRDSLVGSGF